MIQNLDDWNTEKDRKIILKTLKELYNEFDYIDQDLDDKGSYGIRYKTVNEDSFYADTHEQFFRTELKRDQVFEDWNEDRYWDKTFNQELQYRVPTPNFYNPIKIIKNNGKIYIEDAKVSN